MDIVVKILTPVIVTLCGVINTIEIIRYAKKYKNIPMANICLTLVVFVLYFNYVYTHSLEQMLEIVSLTYCSIVITLNRRYRFPDKVNAILFIPFVASAAYFVFKIIRMG